LKFVLEFVIEVLALLIIDYVDNFLNI